ncbi:MAG TPA: hypothetical protein VM165_05940 [Planctomycetaceae bacterium]|nr:hypothetical protein [Planctomycetaceae bacterium]
MNNLLDRLQQAWQSQRSQPIDVEPDQLLKVVRLELRGYFWADMTVILVFVSVGAGMVAWAFRDIQQEWPWLIYSACLALVVGFILFNRWRRRRHAAHYDEPLLAHVEGSIKDIEHQMWLDRYSLWWYILPTALACMIPPAMTFAMEYRRNPGWGALFGLLLALLVTEGFFAALFCFIHWSMKRLGRVGLERQRQELQALRALRETLLETEEPHA